MASTSPGYGITIRVEGSPDVQPVALATTVITAAGATITALDVVESLLERVVIDITCDTIDSSHADEITAAISANPELTVRKVSDRTFLLHLGGKIEISSKVPLKTRDDLSRAYTPGVARICQAIAADPSDARRLTIKRNTVAVVTDGSAVLGLGNIGPAAALPVMEGKAALFKRADVDAWPVCLDTQDVDEIVRTVQLIAPVYGGINLEDISAPRCFEVERRLRELLDIPVFHDDQHGTAIVVLAALRNSLRLVKKDLKDTKIVLSGAGAAGTAIARLLVRSGAVNIIGFDKEGVICKSTPNLNDEMRTWFIDNCNPQDFRGTIAEAMKGADIFIGVSAPNVLTEADVASMAPKSIIFALANPDPEIDPTISRKYAAVVATGRSDQPNQINNVLAFPGIFRGLLDANAHKISDEMLVAAAEAIADCVSPEQLNASFIVPSVFDPNVVKAVAAAVKKSV